MILKNDKWKDWRDDKNLEDNDETIIYIFHDNY